MEKQLSLQMGALSDDICDQLDKQGFNFNPDEIKRIQMLADSISTLAIKNIITQSAVDRARKKIFKMITDHVRKTESVK